MWLIVVVMGEAPSPPPQLIDSVPGPVSPEVGTEGGGPPFHPSLDPFGDLASG